MTQQKLVWVNRIYSKNFITDFIQEFRNIVGGRLKGYEDLMNHAYTETWKEFNKKYPSAEHIKVDVEHMVKGTIMISITGVINGID